MLAVVLVGALIAQTGFAAPSTNCAELCDDQSSGNFGQSRGSSSYSSYSKSSYGHGMQGLSGSGNLGLTSGRLENLDENVIGTSGLERPGNWQDEKHYVTDDGKGQMSYRAGQTVSNNGYSKFAQHSYSYGSHESHAPLSNSQVLSTEQFGRELQNMRNRINNFMGNFHLGIGSNVNANLLQDFKSKASMINNQLSNVCNQVDVGSSMYQQMQLMMSQFQRDVEQKQHEMESIIYQNSGGSSSSTTHGSNYRYPTMLPAQYDEQLSKVQNLISSFYSTFNRPDTNAQFQQDLNAQVDVINAKLADLNYESVQNESERKRIDHLKKQFETYVSQIHTRIQEIEQRNQEEEARRKDRELQLKLEKLRQEELLRLQHQEEERTRLQQQEEERIRLQQQEEERIRLQQQEEERIRLQQQEEERIRLQQQEEERIRLQQQEEERMRLQHQQEEENKRIRQEQDERARLALLQQQQSKIKILGSSTYEHSITGSYGAPAQGSTSGYTESYKYGSHSKPQPVIQPHVDLTAVMSRLQQDLNRLQTEVNNFNMYKMRLTSANSVTIVGEAERQAEQLRERINNLCETSSRYQNHNIQTSAEDLGHRFEELFRSFQSQVANYSGQSGSAFSAGYSSESSYGTSGHYGTVRAPAITNVEYEHSKSMDVEVGRRPATSQSYTSGSGYSSSRSYGAQGADGQYRTGLIDLGQNSSGARQVECVEMNAGQPCVEQPRRHRRYVGEEEYDSFSDLTQQAQDSQQHQQMFSDLSQHNERVRLLDESKPMRNKIFNLQIQRPTKPEIQNLQQGRQIVDLSRQAGDVDDFYLHQTQSNQVHSPLISEYSELEQKKQNLFEQNINLELTKELESLEKSQNKNLNFTHNVRKQIQLLKARNSGTENDKEQQNNFNDKLSFQQEILNATTEPPRVQPITILEKFKPEKKNLNLQINPLIKLESNQETEKFTLEDSTFDDYQQHSRKPQITGNQRLIQSTNKIQEPKSAQNLEHFTLEKSGFNDYPSQNGKLKLNSELEQVQPLASKNLEINQEVGDGSSYSLNKVVEKSEKFGSGGFSQETQQTISQPQLNLESQVADTQEFEFAHQSKHPIGQQSNILSQQQQPSYNLQIVDSYQHNERLKNINNENIFKSTEKQELITVALPTVKPLTKPTSRYIKPWQVNQIHTIPKQPQNNQKQTEHENVHIGQNLKHTNLDESTPQSVSDDKQNDNDYQKSSLNYDFRQQHQQINLYEKGQLYNFQKSRNYDQVDHQSNPTKFNEEQKLYQFNRNQENNFENEQQREYTNDNTNYRQFEQKNFNQQTQDVSFDQQQQNTSSFEQISQISKDNLSEGKASLDKTKNINTESETETNTTPHTFWKRVGHKLSDSVDKVKEKVRTIFG